MGRVKSMSGLSDHVCCWVKFSAAEVRGKAKDKHDIEEDGQNELQSKASNRGHQTKFVTSF